MGTKQTWITSMHNKIFTCPVCGYNGLLEPAYDEHGCSSFEICPSCGTEFGNDDAKRTHKELRNLWLSAGAPWKSKTVKAPVGWTALGQLQDSGLKE
jgi:predicted RNA-binding Zn-ribbon protein involved in translation (DUF1610 family)